MTDVPHLTDAQLSLLDKYLAGECSASEHARATQLLAASPTLACRISAIAATVQRETPASAWDTATSWRTFRDGLGEGNQQRRSPNKTGKGAPASRRATWAAPIVGLFAMIALLV